MVDNSAYIDLTIFFIDVVCFLFCFFVLFCFVLFF